MIFLVEDDRFPSHEPLRLRGADANSRKRLSDAGWSSSIPLADLVQLVEWCGRRSFCMVLRTDLFGRRGVDLDGNAPA